MLCISIFIQTLEEWQASKFTYLKRIIIASKPKNTKETEEKATPYHPLLLKCRPSLIYILLIDRLHKIMKKASGKAVKDTIDHSATDKWIIDVKDKIKLDHMKVLEQMNKLLNEYETELLAYVDPGEFFDDLEILSSVHEEEKDEIKFISKLLDEQTNEK